jgi:N-acetylglucosaminyldiphosphoundecaprenol N-acetyl-beta-D-mannosaminyltransferase
MRTSCPSFNAIGTLITAGGYPGIRRLLVSHLETGQGGYVCFANAHTTVMARQDQDYAEVINNALMVLPDGRSVFAVGRMQGFHCVKQISGPDFMWALLNDRSEVGFRHYFYGGTEETLVRLIGVVRDQCPNAQIAGGESPPFRELTAEEESAAIDHILESRPDFVWVGLGAPRQEIWMSRFASTLRPSILLGVGAAFDFHAGIIPRAPRWIQFIGFEWLFRLAQEPKRLWKRYAITNTLFVVYALLDFIRGLGAKPLRP